MRMVCFQFIIMACFEVLFDAAYVFATGEDLVVDGYAGSAFYLTDSFLSSVVQYNVYVLVFWFFLRSGRYRIIEGDGRVEWQDRRFLEAIVLLAGVFSVGALVSAGGLSFTYGNAVAGETLEGEAGIWGVTAFLTGLGTACSVYVLVAGYRGDLIWRATYATAVFLTGQLALKVLTGARAGVFTLMLLVLSAAIIQRKMLRRYVIPVGLLAGAALVVFGTFSAVRITGITLSASEASQLLLGGIRQQVDQVNGVELFKRSLREFAWRSGGARMGTMLFKDVDQNGVVGMGAVMANITTVVPRSVWPGRGFGNSRDGSAAGIATYRVAVVGTGSTETNNQSDSVSSASTSYWLLGWPGVVLSAVFGAWFTCYVLSRPWLRSDGGSFPALFFLCLTSGGWILLDIGSWFAAISRLGLFMIVLGVLTGVVTPRWLSARNRKGAIDASLAPDVAT